MFEVSESPVKPVNINTVVEETIQVKLLAGLLKFEKKFRRFLSTHTIHTHHVHTNHTTSQFRERSTPP